MPHGDAMAREALPQVPRRSVTGRLEGRRGYARLDRIERARFGNRLPFDLDGRAIVRRDARPEVVEIDPLATGRSVARANLDLVVTACERASVDYFLIPEPGVLTARVGIRGTRWSAFVTALAELGRTRPVYADVRARTRSATKRWTALVSDPGIATALNGRETTSVFCPVRLTPAETDTDPAEGYEYGRDWACRVERWHEDADGRLVAPARNPRAQFVDATFAEPATIEFAGRQVRTLAPFARPHILDVTFPVDVVYLWVDGDDPAWQARRAAVFEAAGTEVEPDAVADARFRDGDELRYSLRSLAQFAPWVRRIFLVTDRQVPTWLDLAEPRLTVVDHREIFGDAGALPTFNSHAIGARLHHIEGLAEHYLYLNDDIFFGSDVTPATFFEANGQSRFFLSKLALGLADGDVPSHEAARSNVIALIERDFGRVPAQIFYHSPYPQRRSVMTELEHRYPAEFDTTWHNQFRSVTDIEPNTWLYCYYAYLVGAAVPGTITYTYIELGSATAEQQLTDLVRLRDREVFCLNDHVDATAGDRARAAARLAQYFPVPSPFEKRTPPT